MKVAISGSTGLIGSAVVEHLRGGGHDVLQLVRIGPSGSPRSGEATEPERISWDPQKGTIETAKLEGVDAVVHLAGENIAGLWTAGKKRRIRDSRIVGTRTLCDALAGLSRPPGVLLAASAVGYYGSRGEEVLTEESAHGAGFLAEVCREWEAATAPVSQRGVRVVNLRFGVVLSRRGGALRQMLTPFKLGLGGAIGGGDQYLSWITLADAVGAIDFALATHTLRGPVNLTSPHPVTNGEFTKALGRALRRPTVLSVPAWPLRALLGEMARETLLASARAFPQRLQTAGFRFLHEDIDEAITAALRDQKEIKAVVDYADAT